MEHIVNYFVNLIRSIFPEKTYFKTIFKEGENAFIFVRWGKNEFKIKISWEDLEDYRDAKPNIKNEADQKFQKIIKLAFNRGEKEVVILTEHLDL